MSYEHVKLEDDEIELQDSHEFLKAVEEKTHFAPPSLNLSVALDPVEEVPIDDIEIPVLEEEPPLSYFKLVILTIPMLGVQFGWAIQIAFTSALFMQLGVPTSLVSLVWLAGPISGLFVQPIVGAISDKATFRFGRRRPFILGGSIFIVIAMILLSNAEDVGEWFGDVPENRKFAIGLAVLGFWILDLANNTVQGPCKALIVDVAPSSQQNLGGSLCSFQLGVGNLAGYFIGSRNLILYFPFLGTNLRGTFGIGIIVLMSCTLATVIGIKERRYERPKEHKENFLLTILNGLKNMPKPIQRLCLVTFFTWVGWFTFFLYITVWVAQNIYHGVATAAEETPERILFDTGVREGAFALILNSIVSMICSLAAPPLISKIGLKAVWIGGITIMVVCLFLPLFIKNLIGAYALIAAYGLPWAVVLIVPFIVVSASVNETEAGLYLGIVNIFVVLPQLCVSAVIGFVVDLGHGNVAWALAVGGVSAICAVICIFFTHNVNNHPTKFRGVAMGH